MYLRSLTLRGFKSFASTTTLNFEPGITCVVGPNGSGKSNVVDALTWVMGEQGAKSLRGGKMEDVIFAGTSGRAPLGRAEVILTIDNTDGALPIDYTEVTISRTMFRSGGSEYAINGTPARLLDVQDLLSDSGIGREMHVIVGQGQLDSVLQATPETRRHFIEEAAGVLKHRKRKEKALRKLDATEVNLNRLGDLLAELRRQLRPLGRQAEVARKAAGIQADLREAKCRLLADDLVTATEILATDLADETRQTERRLVLEAELERARESEIQAEAAELASGPRLAAAQEQWYALSTLVERLSSTTSIASVRLAHAEQMTRENYTGRDPEAIAAEAAEARAQQAALAIQVAARAETLKTVTKAREEAEAEAETAERQYSAVLRAIADRREGLARLSGEVDTARSRFEAAGSEIDRLTATKLAAVTRSEEARTRFAALETEVASLGADEPQLDREYEAAVAELDKYEAALAEINREEQLNKEERAALSARIEGLKIGLAPQDGASSLMALGGRLNGIIGSMSALISVSSGWEKAVSAALGSAADAVAATNLETAVTAFEHLKTEDLGRAGMLLAGTVMVRLDWPKLPDWSQWAIDQIWVEARLKGAVQRLLHKVALVETIDDGQRLVTQFADVIAVTREGDLLSSWFAQGGSSAKPSLIEVHSAVAAAERDQARVVADGERLTFKRAEIQGKLEQVKTLAEVALDRLHNSDAAFSAITEELALWAQTLRAANQEIERAEITLRLAVERREEQLAKMTSLEERLVNAKAETNTAAADPGPRDELAAAATKARQDEMEARLSLRTLEERMRAIAVRAESAERNAAAERENRAEILARRAAATREVEVATAVKTASIWLANLISTAKRLAENERAAAETERMAANTALSAARQRTRELAKDFEMLVDETHRDELVRAEQRLRIQALHEKAMEEIGIEPETLIVEYGPKVPITGLDADGETITKPYIRSEQEQRLKRAVRDLEILGKINPLALEEFEAMQERHAFLAEQLDDLKKTRIGLLGIIKDVDTRVEEVFAEAYTDVAVEFESAFERLFPGGEGRLILTEPSDWLTTGVDVEARPAGKKVKRLSLLSGGERALVAVAFLVALFKARPSPFYILDEVEAALDDTNLGRLLGIYEELRVNSQLLVITHQKRTMEIADALYGITMRADGVSTVISQRLRDE